MSVWPLEETGLGGVRTMAWVEEALSVWPLEEIGPDGVGTVTWVEEVLNIWPPEETGLVPTLGGESEFDSVRLEPGAEENDLDFLTFCFSC